MPLLTKDKWFLAIREKRPDIETRHLDLNGYRTIPCPRDRFQADPFLLRRDGRSWLFFEEYRYVTGKGVIACAALDEKGMPVEERVILEKPYHLSYPNVFEHNDDIWMIPETSQNQTVELYRCRLFPWAWELSVILLDDISLSDVTVHLNEGTFWLFASRKLSRTHTHELLLYSSPSLHGPWKAHPSNPIVTSQLGVRAAGNLFRTQSQLIRPGQDCSQKYGGAIQFNRILTLNPQEYREESAGMLMPDPQNNWHGLHTYNADDTFEIVDGFETIFDFRGKVEGLIGKSRYRLQRMI